MPRVLDRIDNKIGFFAGVPTAPPPGMTMAILTASMPPAEVTDTTNYLRLALYAGYETGGALVARTLEWHGGPSAIVPALSWSWHLDDPPLWVTGAVENGTQGDDSPAIVGLKLAFSIASSAPLPRRWWKAKGASVAFQSWLQRQDRGGRDNSPVFAIPAAATGITVRIIDNQTFLNPNQRVRLRLFASFNGGVDFEEYGATSPFAGGDLGLDKLGNPKVREMGVGITPTNRPTHAYVSIEVWGSVTFGVDVQFDGA